MSQHPEFNVATPRPSDQEDVSWMKDGLRELLPSFRWSGLSGRRVPADRFDIVDAITLDPGRLHLVVASVASGKQGAVSSMFWIPVALGGSARGSSPGFSCRFPGGTRVQVRLPLGDTPFWYRVLSLVAGGEAPARELSFTKKDGEIGDLVRMLNEDPEGTGCTVSFLGGGDTTNIVFKIRSNEELRHSFVVKCYPRVTFNPTSQVAGALREGGFQNHARLLGACELEPSRIEQLLTRVRGEQETSPILSFCREIDTPASAMFPFLHVFEYIPGKRDGGHPFWISALKNAKHFNQDMSVMDLAEPAGKVASSLSSFHACLAEHLAMETSIASKARASKARRIEAKLEKIDAFLKEARDARRTPLDLPGRWGEIAIEVLARLDMEALRAVVGEAGATNQHSQIIHQDMHLSQFMIDERHGAYVILDLEGDPQLPWEERMAPWPVEKDLAALVRSLSYIKVATLKQSLAPVVENIPANAIPLLFILDGGMLEPGQERTVRRAVEKLNSWEKEASKMILTRYESHREMNADAVRRLAVARAVEEMHYEITYRPSNATVPLVGLLECQHETFHGDGF